MDKARKFRAWLGKTTDESISERREELKSEDPRVRHRAEMSVKKYLKYLPRERELAPNTMRVYFTAIRKFPQRSCH